MPETNKIKAVFFDCDGLLVDSEPLGINIARQTCAEFGIPITETELQACIGISDRKWYSDLLEKHHSSLNIEAILARHLELNLAQLDKVQPFAGAKELPRQLKNLDYPIALVSGSTRAQIDVILKTLGLEGLFDIIITSEDVGKRSKPDPYGYQLALEKLNESRAEDDKIKPEEVLVLEDAVSGIRAGLAANMKVIGVKNAGIQDISAATNTVDSLDKLIRYPVDNWATADLQKKSHKMPIKRQYFEMIRSGEKTLELRIGFPNFAKINIGDNLAFCSGEGETINAEVTGIRRYSSLREVMENEDVSKIAPQIPKDRLQIEARKVFSKANVASHGLIIFEFKLS